MRSLSKLLAVPLAGNQPAIVLERVDAVLEAPAGDGPLVPAPGDPAGAVFALFVIAVAAAEVGVGLAIVLVIYRNRQSVDLDDANLMKG